MTDDDSISLTFLGDGWQQADDIARQLAAFLDAATATLDIAIYDCALTGSPADIVGQALQRAVSRGVTVRVGYYAGPHQNPTTIPAHPSGSEAFLQPLGLDIRPISGFHALMHDKYVIRDVGTDGAAVWTGSSNWTADSWNREENVLVHFPSRALADLYQIDFTELWQVAKVDDSGSGAGGRTSVQYGGEPVGVQVWFSPALGVQMAHAVADAVRSAERRVIVASPVLTVGSVLGALQDILNQGQVQVTGVYDRTQMDEVLQQWGDLPNTSWKIDAFKNIVSKAGMSGKRSTPYGPGTVHDYMHAKMVIVDDSVFLGSYNFSHSGEENAENVLRLDSVGVAEACATYAGRLIERYKQS